MNLKIKNILPYFLALIILVGIFGLVPVTHAQTITVNGGPQPIIETTTPTINTTIPEQQLQSLPSSQTAPTGNSPVGNTAASAATPAVASPSPSDPGTCVYADDNGNVTETDTNSTRGTCGTAGTFTPSSTAGNPSAVAASDTPLKHYLDGQSCGIGGVGGTIEGCILHISYALFDQLPSAILWGVAYFFNVLISITLTSTLFTSPFISTAWGVVRDLSNIFFILILLYAAIQLILDIGGSDAKKIIARVIIVALLINFSMFFTEVVIDSSNILALIFYNKMQVDTKNADGSVRAYASVSGERDVSGAMVNSFDPTRLLSKDFFEHAGVISNPGQPLVAGPVPVSMVIFIFVIAGALMLFASYAFFIAGLSFLGRLIELFMLIVFSPFAFMSFSVPFLSDVEDIGWKKWSRRLIESSFMAPIFMFFMYFLFLLIGAKMFDSLTSQSNPSTIVRILGIVIPALLILVLLMKAAKYAKKGSGQFGEMVIKGTEIAMGATAGLALGGAAVVGQATIGQASSRLANSEWAKRREAEGRIGGALFRRTTQGLASSSFDARKGIVGAGLAVVGGVSGLNLGHKTKYFMKGEGGFDATKKRKQEANIKRNEQLKVNESDPLKQKLNRLEDEHQDLLRDASGPIEDLERQIKAAEANSSKAAALLRATNKEEPDYEDVQAKAKAAARKVLDLTAQRKEIKDGGFDTTTGKYRTNNGLISAAIVKKANEEKAAADNKELKAKDAATAATKAKTDAITAEAKAIADETAANATGDASKIAAAQAAVATATKAKTDATTAETNAFTNQTTAVAAAVAATAKANTANTAALAGTGNSINDYEDKILPDAQHAIVTENRNRAHAFATTGQQSLLQGINFLNAGGTAARAEFAHQIRMGAKIETKK